MRKLILSGAAFAALTVGAADAADLAVRPVYRAPRTAFASPFPIWQPPPLRTARAPRNNLVNANASWRAGSWRAGSWRASPRWVAASTARSSRRAAPETLRAGRQAGTHAGRITGTPSPSAVPQCTVAAPKKQYWATSLSSEINRGVLQGLQDAIARGEVGWLDVNPDASAAAVPAGANLILYHVGGNCYAGGDCNRFASSKPAEGRWGREEREIDLTDPQARKIVVADMVALVRQADQRAPAGATVGVHLDNVHRLDATGLARVFNDYLEAVGTARQDGLISSARRVGYVAKNNPEGFKAALERGLLKTAPLYQINENATLDQNDALDESSRAARELGLRYNVPVFLMTFGTEVAYTAERDGKRVDVLVSQDMARRMAQIPSISGVAWSPDEAYYHPTLYVPGAPIGSRICEKVASALTPQQRLRRAQ